MSNDHSRGLGILEAHKSYRNASTHRFTVLHDFGKLERKSPSLAVDRQDSRSTRKPAFLTRAFLLSVGVQNLEKGAKKFAQAIGFVRTLLLLPSFSGLVTN